MSDGQPMSMNFKVCGNTIGDTIGRLSQMIQLFGKGRVWEGVGLEEEKGGARRRKGYNSFFFLLGGKE